MEIKFFEEHNILMTENKSKTKIREKYNKL